MKKLGVTSFTLLLLAYAFQSWAEETALDRYVAKPDPSYTFHHIDTDDDFLYTHYFIDLTSQQWRSTAEVDRVLWQHDLIITVPEFLHSNSPNTAILLIDGGSNNDKPVSSEILNAMAAAALAGGSVIVVLKQVPNQPLFFTDEDNRARKEDEILAYSLDKFLATGDPEWPVHLPMTKSVVRAMDTVQTFLDLEENHRIDDFIILGGSKRGWATWLTAAVDPRVKAIAPASIDFLNLVPQIIHHREAYGFYTPAVQDYMEFNLFCRQATPRALELLRIIDAHQYRERYTMPKFVANSAGDQFFVSTSSQFYYADLPGPKLLRYSPNTDHGQNINVILSAVSWVDDINDGKDGPQYTWTFEPDGSIRVETVTKPDKVRLWRATNPDARDFRLETIGEAWTSSDLQDQGDGVYIGRVDPPAQGWTAFMVELTFDQSGQLETDQIYTTDIRVIPDTLPFAGIRCADLIAPPPQP